MCPRALHLQRQVSRSDSHPTPLTASASPRRLRWAFPGPLTLCSPPPSGLSYLPRRAALVSAVESQRITFPGDFSFLVLTMQEKRVLSVQPNPFKHSLPPTPPPAKKKKKVPGSRAEAPDNFVTVLTTLVLDFSTSSICKKAYYRGCALYNMWKGCT